MHDPCTQAFSIKSPFKNKHGYRNELITIWHVDPCKGPGGDDTCGWFMRSYHGDQEVLKKIISRFDFDWDRTYTSEDSGKVYFCGYFYPHPTGSNHHSVHAIALNLFLLAACEVFGTRKKASKWMSKHLFEILMFAENPVDSLHDGFTCKFGNDSRREERIERIASCIYGWILRKEQAWYQHPCWHVHHWKLQVHFLQKFKRAFVDKCKKCGKGFKWNESVCTDWNRTAIWHDRCEDHRVPVKTESN